jgi:hypothetical protein
MLKVLSRTPKPVILLILAFLCPTELSIYIGTLRIPPYRVALILLIPLALWRFVMQRKLKIRTFDVAFLLFNVWTVGVFTYHHGSPDGLVNGGSLALDGLGAYLVARVWIRDVTVFQDSLRMIGYVIALAALIALPETLFGQIFTHDFLKSVTGYVHPTGVETRLGLTRAYGTFDHPIHYGAFCAALLSLFWYAGRTAGDRRKRGVLLAGATILGLSSAPMLCLMLQTAMLVWERYTRGIANRTSLTFVVLFGLYVGASMVMNRTPFGFIATGMTLDPSTGFYRIQIWDNGVNNVFAHPFVGIGMNDWDRPQWMFSSTVDAFWLLIAMREGIPALVLIVAFIAFAIRAVYKRGLRHPDFAVRRFARGWIMSLIALSLVGVTVHFWNVLYAFYFFFMGLAGWMGDPMRVRAMAKSRVKSPAHLRPALPPQALPNPFPAGGYGPMPQPV